MKKRMLIFILVILVGLIAFYGYHYVRLEIMDRTTVSTPSELSRKKAVSEMSFTGRVEASDTFTVDSMVTGEVFQVYANQGRKVMKGDTIVLIDNRKEIDEIKAVWDESMMRVTEARVKASAAVSELNRLTPSFDSGEMSAELYQKTVDRVNLANEELTEAIRESEDVRTKYENAFENAQVKAPADGRIADIKVRKDQEVKSGDTVFELEETSIKYISFNVEKDVLSEIFPGKTLNISIRDISFYGKIIGISAESEESEYYIVKALPKEDINLPEGMSVSVRLGEAEKENKQAEDTEESGAEKPDTMDNGKKL